MQTRLPALLPSPVPPRYIRPQPPCPFCQRKFASYNEVYLHARSIHHQTIDSTFTCELCKQVCQNRKGLHVHKTHSHRELTRSRSVKIEEEGEARMYKRRRLKEIADTEDDVWHTPVKSPLKSELPSPLAAIPLPRLPSPEPTSPCVTCPVCAQVYSKEATKQHITVHDEVVTKTYCDLNEVAKVMVAGLVMEMIGVKKYRNLVGLALYIIGKLAVVSFLLLLHGLHSLPRTSSAAISLRKPTIYHSNGLYQATDYTLVVDIYLEDTINADWIAIEAISTQDKRVELALWVTKEGKYRVEWGDQREIIDLGKGNGWKRVYLAACWRQNKVQICDFSTDFCAEVEVIAQARDRKGEMQAFPLAARTREAAVLSSCVSYAELKDFSTNKVPNSHRFPMRRLLVCDSSCFTCSNPSPTGCLSCFPGFALSLGACHACDPTCQTCQIPSDSTQCLSCSGTATVTSPPGVCVCPSGTYWLTSPYLCNPCSTVCLTCSGTATLCTSCQGNASLSGGICTCDLYYFANPDASLCSLCAANCKTCGNTVECLDCVSPAVFAFKQCYCVETYYAFPTPRNCLPCHPTCFSCFAGLITDCASCWMNAELVSGGPRAACQCISAFYPDPDPTACKPCYASCLTCTNSSPSSCLSCISYATLTAGSSCLCNQGYFLLQVPPACSQCDSTCWNCQGGSGNECTACASPSAILIGNTGSGYCLCGPGFFPNPTAAICTVCYISCLTCIGAGPFMCTSCYPRAILNGSAPNSCVCLDGFYPNLDASLCQPCDSTCLTCVGSSPLQCLTCTSPFVFSSGSCTCPASSTPPNCIICHPSCVTCTGVGAAMCTVCQANAGLHSAAPSNCVCANGYVPSPGSDNCQACDVSCLGCYSPAGTDCYACYPNALLLGGNAPSTCVCNSGYFPNLDLAHCSPCDISCFACSGSATTQCSLCYPNAVLSSGTCTCSPMYFPSPNVTNCLPCHYTCHSCTGTLLTNCTSCFTYASLSSHTCNCIAHYYPNPASNNCSLCAAICKTCDSGSAGHCLSCYSGAGMPPGALRSQCGCLVHHYTLSDAAHCLPCDPSCDSCSNGGVPDCLSCYPNASLTSTSPSPCDCDLFYYPNPHAGLCAACNYSCFTCTGPAVSNCATCDPNATLSAGRCTCVTGYYMTTSGPVCYICNVSCVSCSNGYSCDVCYSNAALTVSGGTTYCNCVLGYYPAPTAVSCQLCYPTCKGCTGPLVTDCSQCFAHEHLGGSGSCDCNTSCFRPTVTSHCQTCHSSCYGCSGGNGPSDCTLCYSNASLAGLAPSSCLCNIRYYPSPSPNNCISCDPLCLVCSGLSLCSLCDANSSLEPVPNSGLCACNPRFYYQSSTFSCVQCHTSCLSCASPLATGCLTCGTNATVAGPPGVCICTSGYYMDTVSPNCILCDTVCSQCTFAGSYNCIVCKGTASLLIPPGPSPCFCSNNYHLNPSTGLCDYCDLTCSACLSTSLSACTACWPGASLIPQGGPGYCQCNIGYFPAPTAWACARCHYTCRVCQNSSPLGCLDCYNFAELSGSACVCIAHAYPSPDSSSCYLCPSTCLSCTGPAPNSCTSCNTAGYLQGPAPNLCLCSPGFFPDPDASQCSACLSVCATCLDAVTCSSCRTNADLNQDWICECVLGTVGLPDASNCVLCGKGCQSCLDIGCLECLPGYYLLHYDCYEKCPIGYEEALHSYCTPADMSPPVPTLAVLSGNGLAVSFDKPMNFTISSTDIAIDVITPNGDLSPVTWSEPIFQTSDNFTLSLHFQSSYLPPNSQANFSFLSPSQVLSAQEVPTVTLWLTTTLFAFGVQPVNNTATLQDSSLSRNTAAAVKGVVAVTAATSILSGGFSGFISLINQLQLITYLSMTNLPLTVDFAETLAAANVGNMLPNPLSQYISVNITVEEAISPPDYVANYGINTVLFLSNAWSFLAALSFLLLSYLPTHFLAKSSLPFIAHYCQNRMKSLTFSTPLLAYLTSYLDLCLFSQLQIAQIGESLLSVYTWISLLVACVFVAVTWATPIVLVVFTAVNRAKMMSRADSKFNERWGVLYMDFAQGTKVAVIAFYSLFVVRRLMLVVTLVLFPSVIYLFAVLNSSTSLLSVLYMGLFHPYSERFDHIEAMTIEAGTAVVYFLASAFALPLSSSLKAALNEVGMWSVRTVIALNFLFSLCKSALALAEVIRAYSLKQRRYELHDSSNSVNTREVQGSGEDRGRLWW